MFRDIKTFFLASFPTLTIIFFTFFNLFISNNFVDFGQLFIFQAIFFWLLYTPKLIPFYLITLIAILQDIIYLLPLGSSALVFLFLIFIFEKINKLFLEPSFIELFISFTFLFIIGTFSYWSLGSIINLQLLPIQINIFYEVLINLFVFPINFFILHFFFNKLNLNKIK
tara:strand:- start:1100 stop:1606 length:507 start_codon:yes stop_codon:yes gene_type:complete